MATLPKLKRKDHPMNPSQYPSKVTPVHQITTWIVLAALCLPSLSACYTTTASIPPQQLPRLNNASFTSQEVYSDINVTITNETYSRQWVTTTEGNEVCIWGYFDTHIVKKNGDDINFEPYIKANYFNDTLTIYPGAKPAVTFKAAEIDRIDIKQLDVWATAGLIGLGVAVVGIGTALAVQ